MTAGQLTTLKNELIADPSALGYATPWSTGQDWKLAEIVNEKRVSITLKRTDVRAAEIVEAIDVSDIISIGATPTAAQLSLERRYLAWLALLPAMGTVRLVADDGVTLTAVGKNLDTMFPSGPTRARILALQTKPACSRAEQLFGYGVTVSATDVSEARKA